MKDLKKIVATSADEVRRQAIVVLSDGEDTSSLLPFEEVLDLAKRSETAIYAIGLQGDEGSSAREASRKRSSSCGSSRRKPAAARSSRTRFPSWPASTGRSPTSCRASTRVGYTSRNQRRDGAWRRVVVRIDRPNAIAADQARLLRAEPRSIAMNFVPLALYAAALIAYAWHFARRSPSVGHAATTLLVAGALAHTFVIGMQTMEVGHVPITDTTTAISTFVWLLALAYLYTEMTTDERAMGVFILPLLVALQTIPALNPGIEPRSAVLQGPLFGIHVSSLLFAYASFALACVIGITYVLLFKEIKAKHLGFFYARLPSLQVLDRDEPARRSRSAGSS